MKTLIKGGLVVDPARGTEEIADILLEDARIVKIAKNIARNSALVIDAAGKVVLPGLVDMHVHLREPGREDKETILSGTLAALKGGITSVMAMPNTMPCPDCKENLALLKEIIARTAQANVYVAGAITRGRQGILLTDTALLKKEGAVAISDDGASVDSEELMREAFKNAKDAGMLIVCHCEDKALSAKGVVNLGLTSTRMGLRGISKASEYTRVERDIALAGQTGARVHIAHVSCAESVEIIAAAKKKGVLVSAETCPHYFALSEEAVLGYDTNTKMNPPLRGVNDVRALKKGLADGTVDVIASDHAPHTENEKEIEFERAEFGTVGLETMLAVSITELIHGGIMGWKELAEKLSLNPAKMLGIKKGALGVGEDADIVVVDAQKEWRVEKSALISKSKNSAFLGRSLKGCVELTICAGKIAYKA